MGGRKGRENEFINEPEDLITASCSPESLLSFASLKQLLQKGSDTEKKLNKKQSQGSLRFFGDRRGGTSKAIFIISF